MTIVPNLANQACVRPSTVVIADDSVVVRGLFARWLGESGRFHVVGVAGDGEAAVEHAERHHPDIMVLDLDMPFVDGVEALPRIVKQSPQTAVLLTTTLTERNARLALQCMTMGAVDVLPKPDSRTGMTLSLDFRGELLGKLANIAQSRMRQSAESLSERNRRPQVADLGDAALSGDRRLDRRAARHRPGSRRSRRRRAESDDPDRPAYAAAVHRLLRRSDRGPDRRADARAL